MKKVEQTSLTDDGTEVPGDCLRAAWASVLETDIEEILQWTGNHRWAVYWRNLQIFFRLKGYKMKRWKRVPPTHKTEFFVASGPSPRHEIFLHAVVYSHFGFEWDPYPGANGLEESPKFYEWLEDWNPKFESTSEWKWGEKTDGERKVPPIEIC